uniref:Uncharacterized protein n=1 Tax=Arundo donax TaxID=35708 RepID=A0A0A9BRS3_ARUDO
MGAEELLQCPTLRQAFPDAKAP